MEENNENNEQSIEETLPPITLDFIKSTKAFLCVTEQFPGERWNDCVAQCFHDTIDLKTRHVATDYLKEFLNLIHGYEVLIEEAEKLTKWNAGMGGWLSFNQISMLMSRQISRFLTGRDGVRL
ncbi:MAG: hypothetical protein MJZ32_10630 [Bacteroidaceae bacterium]|nr:hypothetical protein [Bacteroidaceae bacterium]